MPGPRTASYWHLLMQTVGSSKATRPYGPTRTLALTSDVSFS
jgi:hypothetical protein